MNYELEFENAMNEINRFKGYDTMSLEEKRAIAEDMLRELDEHDVFLHEYLTVRFERLSPEERRQYLPISELAFRMPENVNIRTYKDKYDFNKKAGKFVSREYISLEEASKKDFEDFMSRHEKMIAKPLFRQRAEGICGYNSSEHDPGILYNELIQKGTPLVEECLIQHPDTAAFHPQSLNTIRATTFTDFNGEIVFEEMYFKMGCGDAICDNTCIGGIIAPIDINSGILTSDGSDVTCHEYKRHPDTGKIIKGSVIPCFDKVKENIAEYVRHFDSMHIVGWDIAVKANGDIELIEANHIPELTLVQKHFGMLAETYRKYYG